MLLFLAASVAISKPAQDSTVVLKSLPDPAYSPLARIANVSGDVRVLVSVGRDGTVASATALSGPPMLREAALESAEHSIFDCYACNGDTPYLLVYKFEQVAGNDCCTASAVVPKVEQMGTSHDEQGRPETQVAIVAEHSCICDPATTVTKRVRALKCLYLWKCAVRCEGPDCR